MTLWLAISAMIAIAAALLFLPLLMRPRPAALRGAHDLEVYRDQLAELDRDLARGLVPATEAAAARTEIARRMLAVADPPVAVRPMPAPSRAGALLAVALLAPAAAFALYLGLGAPELALRKPSADAAQFEVMVAELALRMKERPDDARGWTLLARSVGRLGRHAESVAAFARAVEIETADADLRSQYGKAVAVAADGRVTPEARAIFEAALALNPAEPRARYYLGLAEAQSGNARAALARWIALEADTSPNAAWREGLAVRIGEIAGEAGFDAAAVAQWRAHAAADANAPAAAPRGPSAADVAAAQSMTGEERQAMIRGMVEGLAQRLDAAPDHAPGWLRLGRAYAVLGEKEKARAALLRAVALLPGGTPERTAAEDELRRLAEPP